MESNHQLKKFIRSTLGCNCPDEVFDRIDISSDESLTEIVVGGRLLIHLVRPNPNTPEDLFITDHVMRGKTERDAKTYNRFRLVLAASVSDEAKQDLFEQARDGDDKLHLHIIAPEAHEHILSICQNMLSGP
jgi:hypothetical protein